MKQSEREQLFEREPERAARSAEAVMARLRVLGAPDRAPAVLAFPAFVRSRLVRYVAAAALVAVLSSLATLAVIGDRASTQVRFVLEAPEANEVRLAADFNDWTGEGYALERDASGTWSITVPLRKGASYAYIFLIDGERWMPDPEAGQALDDGLGGGVSTISL
ncbi:MAG TPA: isoamylase early set domain-containing protein [Spirochaetales bacterium]|nr:isoamylase early set domain-containing protein [Spirochaetales bacterium]